jgi:hypothetical protein
MPVPVPLRLTKPLQSVVEILKQSTPEDPVWGLRICDLADLA